MEPEVNSLTFAYQMLGYKHGTSHGTLGSEFTHRIKLSGNLVPYVDHI